MWQRNYRKAVLPSVTGSALGLVLSRTHNLSATKLLPSNSRSVQNALVFCVSFVWRKALREKLRVYCLSLTLVGFPIVCALGQMAKHSTGLEPCSGYN